MDSNIIYLSFATGDSKTEVKYDRIKKGNKINKIRGNFAGTANQLNESITDSLKRNEDSLKEIIKQTANSGGSFFLQGDHRTLIDLYTRRQVSCIMGIPEGKLKWWEKCGLIKPSKKYGREKLYTFDNLIAVRAAKELIQKGCSAFQIKNAIKKLCEMLPAAQKPLTKMKVYGNSRRLIIEREGKDVEIDTGQILINFSVSSIADSIKHNISFSTHKSDAGKKSRIAYNLFLEGVITEDEGKEDSLQKAEKLYKEALMVQPTLAPALTNIGNIRFKMGDLVEAERYYRQAIKSDPSLPQPYYNLGCIKLESGRPDLALVFLKKAHELDPDFSDACFHLASALDITGRKEEAIKYFRKFLTMDNIDLEWVRIAKEKIGGNT